MDIAVVGYGRWGKHIVRDLVSIGCRVTVVARSEAGRADALREGAAQVAGRIEEVSSVSGIVVATPTVTHASVVQECLTTGLPVFVEKPLTSDPASAVRLAAMGAGRLFVMEKWRYHPAIEALAEIARSGELGEPVGLRVVRIQWGSNHKDVDGSWTLLPHDLSIVREVLGDVPPIKSIVGHCEGERALEVFAVFGEKPWAYIESCVRFPGERREVQLYCTQGTAIMNGPYEEHVALYRPRNFVDRTLPSPELRKISTEFPLLRELRAFVSYLNGGPPPKGSAVESAEDVAVITQIRQRLGMSGALTTALDT